MYWNKIQLVLVHLIVFIYRIEMETWGQVGYLTADQESIMEDFIKRAQPEHFEASRYSIETKEQVACRFLRAREFRIEDSLILLKKAYDLLKEHDADNWSSQGAEACLGADEKLVKTFYPHQAQGYDRYGRLLCFEHNGNSNFPAIKSVTNRTNLIRYHLYTMEKCYDEYFTKTPKNPAGLSTISMCCICDFENISLSQVSAGLDHLKNLIALDNVCYPEQLGKLLVVNVPGFIAGVWNMIKGLLAPRTQRKIELIASGPEVFKRLKELISPENLPKMYGGLAPNPYKKKPYTEYVAVPRDGQELQKTHKVDKGMIFTIDVYVCEGPIEISISYKCSESNETVFVEKNKMMEVTVADVPSRHQFKIPASEEEKVYTIVWKNSHWMSSRHISYSFVCNHDPDFVVSPSSSPFGIGRKSFGSSGSNSKKLDTPHKMAEPPVYKVHTVEGTIIDGGGNTQQDNIFTGFMKSFGGKQ